MFYAYLTAAVLPYSQYKYENKKQSCSLIAYIIKDSLKVSNFFIIFNKNLEKLKKFNKINKI